MKITNAQFVVTTPPNALTTRTDLSNTPLSFFIALRYITSRKHTPFVNFIFWFSLIGMALGVMTLIIVLSIMNGFQSEIKARYQQILPDAHIRDKNNRSIDIHQLQTPLIAALSPTIQSAALLQSEQDSQIINLHAIDPELDTAIINLTQQLVLGSIHNLSQYGIAIGVGVATKLGVGIGDSVTLTIPRLSITPLGAFPRNKKMTVTALIESNTDQDNNLAIMHLENAKRLFKTKVISQYRIKTNPSENSAAITQKLQNTLPENLTITHWQEPMQALFAAMSMEKRMTGLMLLIIVIVAAFNIISGLIMIVTNKQSDIAILRTLGASASSIGLTFITHGLLIGTLGIGIGAVIGTVIANYLGPLMQWLQLQFGYSLFDPNVFYISSLPSIWQFNDFVTIIIVALSINILSSLYPAWKATQISPSASIQKK